MQWLRLNPVTSKQDCASRNLRVAKTWVVSFYLTMIYSLVTDQHSLYTVINIVLRTASVKILNPLQRWAWRHIISTINWRWKESTTNAIEKISNEFGFNETNPKYTRVSEWAEKVSVQSLESLEAKCTEKQQN